MENWSNTISNSEAARRAGGRRHYNSMRALQATMRRYQLTQVVSQIGGLTEWGTQTRLAAALGVSRSTICRDMKRLLEGGQACPCCGAYRRTG